jgi:NAD(P)-dependent dehydrogenase (short-subunit alcohol dehydrogenase family)
VVIGSSGAIGGALTTALLEAGAGTVRALSRGGLGPAGAVAGRIDLRDEASIAAAAARAAENGPVDLVLVATGLLHGGGVRPERSYRELSAESLAELFAVNAVGPALVAKHFLPQLPRQGRAAFACLSARVGSLGDNRLGGWHGYRASKAALNMLIRNLAIELARTHPEAVCVGLHPGTVDSALSAPFQRGVAREKLFTPTFAAERLLEVLDGIAPRGSGGVYAWDGAAIAP